MIEEYFKRFWDKVDKTSNPNGCWEWTGAKLKKSKHGCFSGPDNITLAHRFSAKYIGGMNIDNQCVCHACDNSSCVNPKHLWIGTKADNNKDRSLKGRSSGPKVKIRTPIGEFESIAEAAKEYRVTPNTIHNKLNKYPNIYYRVKTL